MTQSYNSKIISWKDGGTYEERVKVQKERREALSPLECNRNLAFRPRHFFGDFEYLIDKYLGGGKDIKQAVAKADWEERGFESLKYFLSQGQNKAYKHDPVYLTCLEEGPNPAVAYLKELEEDLHEVELPKGISMHKGSFRVDVVRSGSRHRKTFCTLEEAKDFMQSLSLMV